MTLPPELRQRILEFDPLVDQMTVVDFCKTHAIARRTFYRIRDRIDDYGADGIRPDSTAPHHPARRWGDDLTARIAAIHAELKADGFDCGAISIRGYMTLVEGLDAVPSESTIHRRLSMLGLTSPNARKRPRASYRRFARAQAMELWQLDGFSYRLHDDAQTPVTIYQLIDDATRVDVGTRAWPGAECTAGAINALATAIADHGAPLEVLSDNGAAFAQYRWGRVCETEKFLATHGTWSITGRPAHPRTQGKNERAHRTWYLFLDQRAPATMDALNDMLDQLRQRYNHQRIHQSLGGARSRMTPAQAWHVCGQVDSPRQPIALADLYRRALAYRTDRTAHLADEDLADADIVIDAAVDAACYRRGDDADDIVVVDKNGVIGLPGIRLFIGAAWKRCRLIVYRESRTTSYFSAESGEEVFRIPATLSPSLRGRVHITDVPGAWHCDPPRKITKRAR